MILPFALHHIRRRAAKALAVRADEAVHVPCDPAVVDPAQTAALLAAAVGRLEVPAATR